MKRCFVVVDVAVDDYRRPSSVASSIHLIHTHTICDPILSKPKIKKSLVETCWREHFRVGATTPQQKKYQYV